VEVFAVHDHQRDERIETLRPKSSRIPELDPSLGLAAAAGRVDVLGGGAALGLQRAVGNDAVTSLMEEERSPVHDVISSGGRPLDPDMRADMESRLGHDFSDVRVHDDSAAAASATAVNAHAYTVGSNVVFQRDRYDPSTQEGKTTLAHELTHVVQQRSGPVEGTSAPGGIKISDPSDRFEREAAANAERAMSGPPLQTAAVPAARPSLQRHAAEDEAPVQGTHRQADEEGEPVQDMLVQRAEGEEEEEEPVQGLFMQRAEDEEEREEETSV
jgi:Domain of unknown function (DUF4157)